MVHFIGRIVNHRILLEERYMFLTGLLGILLGAVCLVTILFTGASIPPEGDLYKAVSFNIAIGTFIMTTAVILRYVNFSIRKRRFFRWMLIISTLYSYGVETIQHMRGINPRFTQVGEIQDQILGGLFGLVSLVIIILYIVLAVSIFKQGDKKRNPLMSNALRYGILSTLIAFSGGIWMIVLQGRFTGIDGNIIWLHGLGFHGLQVIPLIAWLTMLSTYANEMKAKIIHLTGLTWNLALIMLGIHTAMGKAVFELTVSSISFYFLTMIWIVVLGYTCLKLVRDKKVKVSTSL
ncbi:hypothetical protein [Metabacillus schmidteae]|uniref:hypothetical protein n=1 Tax=Metabacillus schmidteae TaxID=2730405 RepID=UPI00158C71E3|nr:hypothetical protein [Metabacillus schmidteae]